MKIMWLRIVFGEAVCVKYRQTRGGVLVEFAIVLPLCVFFFMGIIEIGRLLAQYSWVQQTAYNAAFLGSGLSEGSIETGPINVVNTLFPKLNEDKNAMAAPVVGTRYFENDAIQVGIKSDLNRLTGFFPVDVDVKTFAPSVIIDFEAGDPKVFANSDPVEYYDCDGNSCGGTPCGPSVCP